MRPIDAEELERLRLLLVSVARKELRSRRGHVNFDPESVVQSAIVRLWVSFGVAEGRDKAPDEQGLRCLAIRALRHTILDRVKEGRPNDRKNTASHLGDQDVVAATPADRPSNESAGRWFLEVLDVFAASLARVDRQLLALLVLRDDLTTEQAVASIRSDPGDATCAELTIENARQRKRRLRARLGRLLLERLDGTSIPREDLELLGWLLRGGARSPNLSIEKDGTSQTQLRSRVERIVADVGELVGREGLHLMVQTWFPRGRI